MNFETWRKVILIAITLIVIIKFIMWLNAYNTKRLSHPFVRSFIRQYNRAHLADTTRKNMHRFMRINNITNIIFWILVVCYFYFVVFDNRMWTS